MIARLKPWVSAAVLPLALLFVWALILCWPTGKPRADGTTDAGERLREERADDTRAFEQRAGELEAELELVRRERRRLSQILEEIQRLGLALLAAVVLAIGVEAPAAYADAPAYRLTMDGRLCFSAPDAAVMLGAGALVPQMRLELRTLHADRELAAQEIQLLERLRAASSEQLAAALGREARWAVIERELSGRVVVLERDIADGQKRRRRWAAVGLAVGGGVVLGLLVVR